MNQEVEMTEEELHREAIRARLAVLSAANLKRRRREAMLDRVMQRHARTLAKHLVIEGRNHPRRLMRRWLWNLQRLVLSLFFRPYI